MQTYFPEMFNEYPVAARSRVVEWQKRQNRQCWRSLSDGGTARCDVDVIVPNEMISRHNTGVMSPPCSRYCNASAGIANTQSNGLTSSSDHRHTTTTFCKLATKWEFQSLSLLRMFSDFVSVSLC